MIFKLLSLCLFFFVSSCATVKVITPEETKEILAKENGVEKLIDVLAAENLVNNKVVGMVVGVITPKGIFFSSYGYKNKKKKIKMTSDTLFQIGSISKVFTASLLSIMDEEKIVSIHDTIPKFARKGFKPRTEWVNKITLESLATHTSNLPAEYQDLKMLKSAIKFLWTGENIWADLNEHEMWEFVEEFNFGMEEKRHFKYSNVAYVLLGGVLGSQIPGKTYEDLVLEKITQPLKMNDTVFDLNADQKSRLATGYSGSAPPLMRRGKVLPPWSFQNGLNAAGGLYSTAPDMMRFLVTNMSDKESFLGKNFKRNHAKQVQFKKGFVGMGWFLEPLPRSARDIVYHNGIISGYTSYLGFHAETGIGVVVLQNTMNMNYEFGERLMDELLLSREQLNH